MLVTNEVLIIKKELMKYYTLYTLKVIIFICIFLQVKNISMEILDFYENYKGNAEERANAALSKLALKP